MSFCFEFSSRRFASTNMNFSVINCRFLGIIGTQNGGGLNIDTSSESCFIQACQFERISGSDGGAAFLSGKNVYTTKCSFYKCNGQIGSSIYSFANGGDNHLNFSVFDSCVASVASGWIFKEGQCIANMINSTSCYCAIREPTGHFGWAPPYTRGTFILLHHNTGKSIFRPNSRNVGLSVFDCMLFVNNTSSDVGLIYVSSGQCVFKCCSFCMNTGSIYSHQSSITSNFVDCTFIGKTLPSLPTYENCNFIQTQSAPLAYDLPSQCVVQQPTAKLENSVTKALLFCTSFIWVF